MDALAQFGAEHVIDEPVLGDPAEATERVSRNDSGEMVPVTGNLRVRAGNSGLDPRLQLVGSRAHNPKRSGLATSLYFMKQ